jgi:hypothetical protein
MECLRCLFRYRRPDGYCYQPDPPVFYLYLAADNGFSYYYLYDIGFLEKYEKICESSEEKSVVLFVKPETLSRPFAKGKGHLHTALAYRRVLCLCLFPLLILFYFFSSDINTDDRFLRRTLVHSVRCSSGLILLSFSGWRRTVQHICFQTS